MDSPSDPDALEASTAASVSKVCVVCGDRSYGLNFNAITCESCKAFFRRNALSKKELVCPFSNNCTVTRVTRRFCQRCRLLKCFAVGMKKEHIMSEEDKLKKRKKIESNRAKKAQAISGAAACDEPPVKVKRENEEDVKEADLIAPEDHKESIPGTSNTLLASPSPSEPSSSKSPLEESFIWPTIESSPSEIVNSIIDSPVGSTRIINHLMKTPHEAILVMERIINSPKDALKIISHFINSPGDALKIISKIMNSPFDALTVFTKFMSSPTDALEVITKVIQSPKDVLQFLQQLMRSPEDGLEIMNKFMNAPAEALKMLNAMMNQTARADSTTTSDGTEQGASGSGSAANANLIEIEPSDSIMNNSAQLKVILDRMGEHLNEGSPNANVPSSSTTELPGLDDLLDPVDVAATAVDVQVPGPETDPQLTSLSALFGGQTTTQDIIDMLINQSVNSMDSAILSEAIKLEYECTLPMSSGMPNASPSMYMSPGGGSGDVRALNEMEQAKLNELVMAHQALYAPVHDDISSLIADDYRLKVSTPGGRSSWAGKGNGEKESQEAFVFENEENLSLHETWLLSDVGEV